MAVSPTKLSWLTVNMHKNVLWTSYIHPATHPVLLTPSLNAPRWWHWTRQVPKMVVPTFLWLPKGVPTPNLRTTGSGPPVEPTSLRCHASVVLMRHYSISVLSLEGSTNIWKNILEWGPHDTRTLLSHLEECDNCQHIFFLPLPWSAFWFQMAPLQCRNGGGCGIQISSNLSQRNRRRCHSIAPLISDVPKHWCGEA